MKILITGATGFIGSHLVRHLRDKHEIFALARRPRPEGGGAGVHWVEQDLSQPLRPERLPKEIDAIVHLAQSRLYRQFPNEAKDIFDVNMKGTFHLLEYARQCGAQSFVFASSGGVYGYSYEKFVETDPVNPLNFYLSSKYAAELLIANYQPFFRTVVLRFFFVYGPGQEGMLIPTLLGRARKGQLITIEGNPGLRINPIYIEDAIRVFEPALHFSKSALFNVAGDEIITITELVERIGTIVGKRALVQHTNADPQGDLVGDNAQMKTVLGIRLQTSLLDGLRAMLEVAD